MPQFGLKVQDRIDKGWRKEALKTGQLWDLIRDFSLIKTKQYYLVTHWGRAPHDIEADPDISFFYRVRGGRKILQTGDMLVGLDPPSKREASALLQRYTVVSMRLLRDNIAIRTDEKCKVYRNSLSVAAGAGASQYNFACSDSGQILAFDPHMRNWQFVDQPPPGGLITDVWAGITSDSRGLYTIPFPTPQSTIPTGWTISHGLLPGVEIRESDIFVDPDGNKYRIDRPYFQIEGAEMYQMHATRLRA